MTTPQEARTAAQKLGEAWVVKAQIHAGGRGKGGGVKLAKTVDQVNQYAHESLGMHLITPQTGPRGKRCVGFMLSKDAPFNQSFISAFWSTEIPPALQ